MRSMTILKIWTKFYLKNGFEIFNEVVTPKFAEIGLNNWNGKYLWYSDFNKEGIKHVIEYNVFKSFGAHFLLVIVSTLFLQYQEKR